MIHNSEDKFITFTLRRKVDSFNPNTEYTNGDYVWYANAYWEFVSITNAIGSIPSDINTDWTLLASAPIYDTADIDGMVIVLYYKGSRNVIEKYSINASVGYKSIDVTNASQGKYVIELSSASTTKKKEGVLLAEIKIREVIAGYTGGDFNTIISDVVIGEVNTPITEFISVP
jgi:hypothetical protein